MLVVLTKIVVLKSKENLQISTVKETEELSLTWLHCIIYSGNYVYL